MKHYITQIDLTPNVVKEQKITDTYSLHRVVYDQFDLTGSCEEGQRQAPLWTVSNGDVVKKLIILSSIEPRNVESEAVMQARSVKEMPEDLLEHSDYLFKITVNPVLVRRNEKLKVIPIKDVTEIKKWFVNKCLKNGMEVNCSSLDLISKKADIFKANNIKNVINKCVVQGQLKVIDPEKFRYAIFNGIGRSKTFGCGLMQVLPIL
ncbi:MAG: type I-E CRISPR-associated protein Cas6/Cse3/CasE [Succinivibrio sp.]|nr:type I-E CRISPR-associated protein Cas6/Cse3/CasE [Succinivibrio sp.]